MQYRRNVRGKWLAARGRPSSTWTEYWTVQWLKDSFSVSQFPAFNDVDIERLAGKGTMECNTSDSKNVKRAKTEELRHG